MIIRGLKENKNHLQIPFLYLHLIYFSKGNKLKDIVF